MHLRNGIPPAILTAATSILQPYAPELSPQALVAALKAYSGGDGKSITDNAPPMTRKEAARFLGISEPTLDRYLRDGTLTPIPLGKRMVRISREEVMSYQHARKAGSA